MPQLPELNTQGIDISNTLAKIAAMKSSQSQQANLQSEIDYRNASLPSLIAERESQTEDRKAQNALRIIQTKEALQKVRSADLDNTTQGLLWTKEHPEQDKAYEAFYNDKTDKFTKSNGLIGLSPDVLPTPDSFYTTKTDKSGKTITQWDSDLYNKFVASGLDATKLIKNPEEGKIHNFIIKNPGFDPNKEVSTDNPKTIQRTLRMENGKLVDVEGAPVVPEVAKVEKEQSAEAHARKQEEISEKNAVTAAKREEDLARSVSIKGEQEVGAWRTLPGTGADAEGFVVQEHSKTGELRKVKLPEGTTALSPKTAKPKTPKQEAEDLIYGKITNKMKGQASTTQSKVYPSGAKPMKNEKTGEKGYILNGVLYNMRGEKI